MKLKHVLGPIKSLGVDGEEGTFTGYASVFGNIDSYGDRMMPGAFTKTLDEWRSSDQSIPVFYGHDMQDPRNNVGKVLDAGQDDHGLWVKCQLDMSGLTHGKLLHWLMKEKRLGKMSFGYWVEDAEPVTEEGMHILNLNQVSLKEVSLVPIPANELAVVTEVKAGRVLSARNQELIQRAYDALGELLGNGEPAEEPKSQSALTPEELMTYLAITRKDV